MNGSTRACRSTPIAGSACRRRLWRRLWRYRDDGCRGSRGGIWWGGDHPIRVRASRVWDHMKDYGTTASGRRRITCGSCPPRRGTSSPTLPAVTATSSPWPPRSPRTREETGIKTVTFGQYNYLRITLFRPRTTLRDARRHSTGLQDLRVGAAPPPRLAVLAEQLHGLDYRVGEATSTRGRGPLRDAGTPGARRVRGGRVHPEAVIPLLRKGEMEVMYGDASHADLPGVRPSNTTASCRTLWSPRSTGTTRTRNSQRSSSNCGSGNRAVGGQQAEISPLPAALRRRVGGGHPVHDRYLEGNDWFADTAILDEPWIEGESSSTTHVDEDRV